ncbi:MAG: TIGR00730 family Rossman fold protein [Prevotellaceae bacterium]|nr:TIGR00730 family Rossman fold protein [Prevotellaceae bacterium]
MRKVCVYCASSTQVAACYKTEAYRLGEIFAANNIHCLYGGGSVGLMGEISKAMIANKGTITGVIPKFMVDQGWNNEHVEQIVVNTMHERKQLMLEDVDAAIALPGGCGTLEELMEAITWKQLGIFVKPIVILNVNRYFDPLLEMLHKAVDEKFMRSEHLRIWSVVERAEEVLPAIKQAPGWKKDAIGMAAL